MFALLPVVLYLLEKSLLSEISFEHFKGIASHWFVKLVILALVWGYMQHFCAGVRHLIMDTHVGLDKDSARKSAATVLVISLALTALVALKLFGRLVVGAGYGVRDWLARYCCLEYSDMANNNIGPKRLVVGA
eukprot:gene34348-38828_t